MRIEQAIFTSVPARAANGYHLVAASPGIGPDLARHLSQWCPSHASLIHDEVDSESLNYTPLGDEWTILSRTVYGGPEYSRRGGLQVVTLILGVRYEHWSAYHFHPLQLADTALALGYLRLPIQIPQRLAAAELPNRPLPTCTAAQDEPDATGSQLADRLHALVHRHEQLALVGSSDPHTVLYHLLARISARQRLTLSFTTGLKPSANRRFRIHFLPAADLALRCQLDKQGIVCVPL